MKDCEHNFGNSYRCDDCGVTRMEVASRKIKHQRAQRERRFNAPRVAS